MAQKDITEKTLEAYNDVFADIVNVLLFNGKRIIDENDLADDVTHSVYKAENKLSIQERDVSKFWKNHNIRMALFGIENQTQIEKDMPLRVISYDGAAYRSQLSAKADKSQKTRYPVITIVLYFGSKRWNKNRSLKEVLDISEDLAPYVSDYKINVFEIAHLTKEQVSMFKSDFKFVADYFVQMNETGTYVPMPENVSHVWETLNLMSAVSNDDSFKTAITEFELDKEGLNMGRFIDDCIEKGRNEGRNEGRIEGIKEGIKEGIIEMAKALLCDGMSAEKVSKLTKLPYEEILQVQNKLAYA